MLPLLASVAGAADEPWRQAALAFLGQAAPSFGLILARTAGMLQQAPVLGSRTVPATARAGLTLMLSIIYWTTLETAPAVPDTIMLFSLALFLEFLTGLLFGFAAMLMFYGFQAAGELVAQQTGLSMMTTLNPSLRTQTTAVGNLFFYLSQFAFLAIGGYLWFLQGYYQTFELVPLGGFRLTQHVWLATSQVVVSFFLITVQIAMPAIMVMFLVDFGLGIINRSSPAVSNILEIVQAVKPTVGFMLLILMVPNTIGAVGQWADRFLRQAQSIMILDSSTAPRMELFRPIR
ncbi:MAG: flagellar biosynthetic protein FliR [Candidatus Sericytochromatia bacterium]|nr:flagellar biosynthetic protein FliR [Candidatus Tanganyikabacteria bacterium]